MANIPSFYRGDTVSYNFTFKDADGLPIDISATKLWFTIKKDPTYPDNSAALQESVTFPSDADSVAGLGSITIAASVTALLSPIQYYYDFQWVEGANVVTLTTGTVTILQDITTTTT